MPLDIAKSYFEVQRLRQLVRDAERECMRTSHEVAVWQPTTRDRQTLLATHAALVDAWSTSLPKVRPN